MKNLKEYVSQKVIWVWFIIFPFMVVAQDEPEQRLFYSIEQAEQPNYKHVTLTDDKSELIHWVEKGDKSTFVKKKFSGNSWESVEEYKPGNVKIEDAISTSSGMNMIFTEQGYHSWGTGGAVYGRNIKVWNWDSEIVRQLFPPDIAGGATAIKSLGYQSDSVELTYLLGSVNAPINYQHIVFQNFNNGDHRTINLVDKLSEEDYPWLTIREYDLSKDGRLLLYRVDEVYVGSDCCYSSIKNLVLMDTQTQEILKIIDDFGNGQYGGAFDLADDGKSFVYQSMNELIRYEVDSNSNSTVLDIPNSLGSITPQPVTWLQLSHDGGVMAYMINRDSSVSAYDSGLGFNRDSSYGLIGKIRNPDMLMFKNLSNEKTVLINKFNNYQLYPVRPISLIDDNEKIIYMTPWNSEFSSYDNNKMHFISHEIRYEFIADESLTGGWYNSENPGQGMLINMAPNPIINERAYDPQVHKSIPIITWYSVDNNGKPYWLIVQGDFQENTIVGDAYVTQGSKFGAAFNAEESETILWGHIVVEFNGCSSATMSYEPIVSGFTAGSIELERLTLQAGIGCL